MISGCFRFKLLNQCIFENDKHMNKLPIDNLLLVLGIDKIFQKHRFLVHKNNQLLVRINDEIFRKHNTQYLVSR